MLGPVRISRTWWCLACATYPPYPASSHVVEEGPLGEIFLGEEEKNFIFKLPHSNSYHVH